MSDNTKEIKDKLRSAIVDVLGHRPGKHDSGFIITLINSLARWGEWLWSKILFPVACSIGYGFFIFALAGNATAQSSKSTVGELQAELLVYGAALIGNSLILVGIIYRYSFLDERALLLSKLPASPEKHLTWSRVRWLRAVTFVYMANTVWVVLPDFLKSKDLVGLLPSLHWPVFFLTASAVAVSLMAAVFQSWMKRRHPRFLFPCWMVFLGFIILLVVLIFEARFGEGNSCMGGLREVILAVLPSTWALMAASGNEIALTQFLLSLSLTVTGVVLWFKWPRLMTWRLLKAPDGGRLINESRDNPEKIERPEGLHVQKQALKDKLISTCDSQYALYGSMERFIGRFMSPRERVACSFFPKGELTWTGQYINAVMLTAVALVLLGLAWLDGRWLAYLKVPVKEFPYLVGLLGFVGLCIFFFRVESGLRNVNGKHYRKHLYHRDLSAWVNPMISPWALWRLQMKTIFARLLFFLPLCFALAVTVTFMTMKRHEKFGYADIAYNLVHVSAVMISAVALVNGLKLGWMIRSANPRRLLGAVLLLCRSALCLIYCGAAFNSFNSNHFTTEIMGISYRVFLLSVAFLSSLLMFHIQAWRIHSGQADWILSSRKKIS